MYINLFFFKTSIHSLAIFHKNLLGVEMVIFYNDVMHLEYKTSIAKQEPNFARTFKNYKITKTWPTTHSEYGDYYIIAQKPIQNL